MVLPRKPSRHATEGSNHVISICRTLGCCSQACNTQCEIFTAHKLPALEVDPSRLLLSVQASSLVQPNLQSMDAAQSKSVKRYRRAELDSEEQPLNIADDEGWVL